MLKNTTKAKLADGKPVFGCFVRTAEPSLIEYVALLGWDFLVLRRRARDAPAETRSRTCAGPSSRAA